MQSCRWCMLHTSPKPDSFSYSWCALEMWYAKLTAAATDEGLALLDKKHV